MYVCAYACVRTLIRQYKKILIALVTMCVCLHVQHNYAHYFLISGLIFTHSSPSSTSISLAFYLSVLHARACAAACVSRALCLLVVIVVVGSACQ